MVVVPSLPSDGGCTNCRSVMNGAQGLPGSAAQLLPVIVLTGAVQPGMVVSPVVSRQDRQPHTSWAVKQQPKGEETQESPTCIWIEATVLGRHHDSCAIMAGWNELAPCVEMSKAMGPGMGTTGATAPTQPGCGGQHENVKCPCPGNTGLSAL